MLASEITTEVQRITAGSVYTDAMVLAVINRGQLEIAGGGDRPHGTAKLAPLPALYDSDTIDLTAGDVSGSMPDTYHRGLPSVRLADGTKLKRYDYHSKFLDKYFGESGTPEAFCLVGDTLFVGPSPASDTTLTIYFFRFPVDLIASGEPDGIPKHLHHRLFVNFVCNVIYSEIEQGIEGHSPDTIKHANLYHLALTDLARLIGFEEKDAVNYANEENSEAVY